MWATEEQKKDYISMIHSEMKQRGLREDEIPKIIAKTGFMAVMSDCPEIQMHYDPYDAVNEILLTAARS